MRVKKDKNHTIFTYRGDLEKELTKISKEYAKESIWTSYKIWKAKAEVDRLVASLERLNYIKEFITLPDEEIRKITSHDLFEYNKQLPVKFEEYDIEKNPRIVIICKTSSSGYKVIENNISITTHYDRLSYKLTIEEFKIQGLKFENKSYTYYYDYNEKGYNSMRKMIIY